MDRPVDTLRRANEFALAVRALEVVRNDKRTWQHPDSYLRDLIAAQREVLKEAAKSLGREWNGMWRDADIQLIAETYSRRERMRDD